MKETILIVDDEDAVRIVSRRFLIAEGYSVIEARTPDEAIAICARYKEPIDLLLSDIILPEISGQELFKRIATLRPKIKVLLMSGYMDDALLNVDSPFLQKPFSGEALIRKIRETLDK
ncbi:MAG: response regulator [Elusimicrobiales bacterium]|jgi:DNA-binding NtrC family response regulator